MHVCNLCNQIHLSWAEVCVLTWTLFLKAKLYFRTVITCVLALSPDSLNFLISTFASKVRCVVKKAEWKTAWDKLGYLPASYSTTTPSTPTLSLHTHYHHNHPQALSTLTHLLQRPDPGGLLLPGGFLGAEQSLPLFLQLDGPLLQPRDL